MNKHIRHWQAEFQTFLFSGANEPQLLPLIAERNNIPAQLRLDVYRNAYYIRLQEAIAHDFPTLLAVAGGKNFGELTTRYIRAHPSTTPSLRDFGKALPQWLHAEGESTLSDVAAVEWAVIDAFDAADKEFLDAEALAQIQPSDWATLTFDFHPSVTLLNVSCNARDCWSAVRNEDKPIPAVNGITINNIAENLVVWRTTNGPAVQTIEMVTHHILALLKTGVQFGECCVELSQQSSAEQAPELAAKALALACNSGWIVTVKNND